jgi:hypothetical protein
MDAEDGSDDEQHWHHAGVSAAGWRERLAEARQAVAGSRGGGGAGEDDDDGEARWDCAAWRAGLTGGRVHGAGAGAGGGDSPGGAGGSNRKPRSKLPPDFDPWTTTAGGYGTATSTPGAAARPQSAGSPATQGRSPGRLVSFFNSGSAVGDTGVGQRASGLGERGGTGGAGPYSSPRPGSGGVQGRGTQQMWGTPSQQATAAAQAGPSVLEAWRSGAASAGSPGKAWRELAGGHERRDDGLEQQRGASGSGSRRPFRPKGKLLVDRLMRISSMLSLGAMQVGVTAGRDGGEFRVPWG